MELLGIPTVVLTREGGFVVANLARHAKVDPEQALRGANAKFERRFHHIERRLAEMGSSAEEASLDRMEARFVALMGRLATGMLHAPRVRQRVERDVVPEAVVGEPGPVTMTELPLAPAFTPILQLP